MDVVGTTGSDVGAVAGTDAAAYSESFKMQPVLLSLITELASQDLQVPFMSTYIVSSPKQDGLTQANVYTSLYK